MHYAPAPGSTRFRGTLQGFNQISSIFCVVSLASACTAMWKSRKLGKNTGPSSRKLFARLCRWLTPGAPSTQWKPFASLVLEAAYEATMFAAIWNKQRGGSNVVLLTLLGGAAFGNEDDWIFSAIRRALRMMSDSNLDMRLVSYGAPSRAIRQIVADFN